MEQINKQLKITDLIKSYVEKKVKFYNRLIEIEKELKKVSLEPRTVIVG